jgi:DNA-binding transcriptional regulator YhcF (GntR family)
MTMEDIIKGIQINSAGFGTISKLAMQDRRLHITAKAIYAYFNSYAGAGDTCFPSRKKICYDLGISADTFGKYLKQLCEYGYIKTQQVKENGRFSHNVYTICSTISPCPKISDTENTVHDDLDTKINSNKNNSISNNNNDIKKERKTSFDDAISEYTSNEELKTTIIDFIKMRKLIKAPMTDRALKGIFKELDKLGHSDAEKIAILEQSIERSWRGVFAISKPKQQEQQQGSNDVYLEDYFKNVTVPMD